MRDGVNFQQNGDEGNREMFLDLANTNVQTKLRRCTTQLVQLFGGSAQDPLGDRLFVKKVKLDES